MGTSADIDWNWDVALNYQGEIGNFFVGAAVAYSVNKDDDEALINGSMSVLHMPSGFSLTLAGGRKNGKPRHLILYTEN